MNRAPPPAGLVPVLALARRWCRILVLTAEVPGPIDAVVVCSPHLIGQVNCPMAVWVDSVADLQLAGVGRAEVVLSGRDEVIEQAGRRGLLVVPSTVQSEGGAQVPVAPLVRSRLRAARNISEPLIIEHDGDAWLSSSSGWRLPADLAATALACASVAVVTGPALLEALAWATPCVTDAESQAMAGARSGRDVLVGDSRAERRRLAGRVAADGDLASRLSWSGRTLIEARHRRELAAASLVRRLRLGAASPTPGPSPLVAQLAQLGTPSGAVVAHRVRMATTALSGARD